METIHFNKHVKVNSIFHFVSLYLPPHIHQCCFVPLFLNHLQARFSYNFIFIFYYFAFFFKYMTCTSILFEGQHRYLFILALRKIKNSFLFNRGLFRKKNKKKKPKNLDWHCSRTLIKKNKGIGSKDDVDVKEYNPIGSISVFYFFIFIFYILFQITHISILLDESKCCITKRCFFFYLRMSFYSFLYMP